MDMGTDKGMWTYIFCWLLDILFVVNKNKVNYQLAPKFYRLEKVNLIV